VKNRRALHVLTVCTLLLAAAATVPALLAGAESFTLLSLGAGLSLSFGADGLSRFFMPLILLVWCLVQFYAFGYIRREGGENQFFGFYILTCGSLLALATARNAVTLYMCFELMSLLSMPLVLHDGTEHSRAAAITYIGYSTLGAAAALMGLFLLSDCAQSLEFAAGGTVFAPGSGKRVGAAALLIVVGFGSKAGLVPLQLWLTEAHPVAPSPASAVLSGVITKGGVLAITRMLFYVLGADTLRGTWVQSCLISLSLLTVLTGSLLAHRERLLKKRLAYSTVSNLAYALFGLLTLTEMGFVGALLQVLFHALAKNALFLAAGSVIFATGCTRADRLHGVGRRMPVTMWCFAIGALSLTGIPPAGGFAAKLHLAVGALEADSVLCTVGMVILMVSALLSAFYLFIPVAEAFFPGRDFPEQERCEVGRSMLWPVMVFSALTLVLGALPAGMSSWLARLAGDLM